MSKIFELSNKFERLLPREVEKKYLPLLPEKLDIFRTSAIPIAQAYLSHPDEEFSLRLREITMPGQQMYEATLKNRGSLTADGLDRLEIVTPIAAETYRYYVGAGVPVLHKLRAEPWPDVAIDWFDGHVHVESEHPVSWANFMQQHRLEHDFIEVTGDRVADNEWRAHMAYRRASSGEEAFPAPSEFDVDAAVRDIWQQHRTAPQIIATIAGRSGSGKSTIIRELQTQLSEQGLPSIVLSTDDYHRGKTWLEQYKGGEWTDWDAPIVYDIEALQADLVRLGQGTPIAQKRFDFATQEPVSDGVIGPAPVVLVEGIYARHASFDAMAQLRYELPTPLATCVGRRLLRDSAERPQFADLGRSLRYVLENAEPAYRAQG